MAAADFFTVEVWGRQGLLTHYVLFVIELATRRVCINGITARCVLDVGILDVVDGPLVDKQYLILDRGTKYCAEFRQALAREGIQVIRLPPRSPNHQGLSNALITPRPAEGHQNGPISRRPRLGGILNYYARCAA